MLVYGIEWIECLFQELVTMLPQLSNDDAGQETEAESSCDPWLLQQFHSRMSQVSHTTLGDNSV